MHVPRVTRYTFLTALFLIVTATAGVFIASHVFADIPYQEAHPFIITPNNHSFALIAGETATTSFVVGALGYTSQYSLDTYPSCLTYDDTNGNCIEYAPDSLLCDYISLTDLDGEDEYKSLNDETDPTDAWMLTLSAPCIEGTCPEGHNDDYQPPLPPALVGTELSCDIRVGGRPVFVKADGSNGRMPHIPGLTTAYAATNPYYVLHVTATITEASSTPACTEHCYSNALFLPGIQGSRLYKPDGNGGTDRLWEPGGEIGDFGPGDDADYLAMNADGTSAQDDIYTREGDVIDNAYVPIKGNVYKTFISDMDEMKENGVINDWTAAPYDWRLSFEDILNKGRLQNGRLYYADTTGVNSATDTPYIIQELKRLASTSKTGKVTIVAHSMGGLVTKALTEKLGTEAGQYIDQIIFVAVPQTGTPKAIGALLHGFDQGLPSSILGNFALSPATARTLAKNMSSAYMLLPTNDYFTYTDDPVVTFSNDPLLAAFRARYGDLIHSKDRLHTFVVDTWRRDSSTPNNLDYPSVGNGALLTQAETLHNTLDQWTPPAGVQLTEIAGWGEQTVATIRYYQGSKAVCTTPGDIHTCTNVPEIQYKPVTVIDGDGTVVVSSAFAGTATPETKRYWVNLSSKGGYNDEVIIDRKHADILEVDPVRDLLVKIITNHVGPLPSYVSTSAPSGDEFENVRLTFILHSPLSIDLYDTQGNHTGVSTTTGELEENIPDSRYEVFGEVKYISVPASVATRLVMNGYTSGSFTLDVEKVQGNTTLASTTFAAVPSATSTIVTFNIPANTTLTDASPLKVDIDGNGATDLTLVPKLGETVLPDLTPPEAIISVDPSAKDLKIEGVDTSSTTVTKANNSYTITDNAGNTTKLFFQKTYTGKMLSFAKLTGVQYNNTSATPVATSSLLYLWNPLVNPPGLLSQTIVVDNTVGIEAVYDKKKNKTTVLIKKKGLPVQTQTFTGLRTIKLTTNKGVIGYQL